jgi:hypothetical protein
MTLPLPEAGGDTPPIGERARLADNLGPEGAGRLFRLVKNHGALIQIDGQGGKVFRCRAIALGFEDSLQDAFEYDGVECRCLRSVAIAGIARGRENLGSDASAASCREPVKGDAPRGGNGQSLVQRRHSSVVKVRPKHRIRDPTFPGKERHGMVADEQFQTGRKRVRIDFRNWGDGPLIGRVPIGWRFSRGSGFAHLHLRSFTSGALEGRRPEYPAGCSRDEGTQLLVSCISFHASCTGKCPDHRRPD